MATDSMLPPETKWSEKIWVRTNESHPIQQSHGMMCQMELAEPSGTRHSSQIEGDKHQADHRHGARQTLGPLPLFW
jgi:hypothetical protein